MRSVAICLASAAAFVATALTWSVIADSTGIPQVQANLDLVDSMQGLLGAPAPLGSPSRRRVALFGDSLLLDDRKPDTGIAARLAQHADQELDADVVDATGRGSSVATHYFLVGEVLRHDPKAAVVALNLRSFSARWRALERVEFSGWIEAARWPEALGLPLAGLGITADQMIFRRAVIAAGGLDAWHGLQRLQVRFAHLYWTIEYALRRLLLTKPSMVFSRRWEMASLGREKTSSNRATPEGAEIYLGPFLAGLRPDADGLAFLDALLSRLARAGIPTLVYVSPVNVEHLESLGLYDEASVELSLSRIRNVCEHQGARFLDLHALLPDAAFSDHLDHMVHARQWGEPEASGEVAGRVSRELSVLLKPGI